ncbi:MAG: alpha/beta fold hydrolase [Burkholderiaceae bacterium]|uniref:alpha/beta fold hydrolase n=1 Tax=Phenylobacterium sp. TaxID=1871053 RepID=UPI0025DA65D3|nr:alpha/beta hydrolase [Phenylobacterium sp.]MCA3040736.1 alpha/beta hydrolase [Rhodocyclaceae bacterium]MCA3741143.1 alpha/beta hydrolase [Phenylobacterium sp.]
MNKKPDQNLISIPWEERDISIIRQGEAGAPILFIHGNSSCKEVFGNLWNSPELRQYSCVAFDLPGHGASSDAKDPESAYTIPGYARAAARVISDLDLFRPVVIGWSLGGHVAIELALDGADLSGLLITGTPPVGPGPSVLEGGLTAFAYEQAMADEDASEEDLMAYAHHMYGVPREVFEPFVPALLRTAGRARTRMAEHWLAHEGTSHLEFAASGKTPLAIAHGDLDPFVDSGFLDKLASGRLWQGRIHHMAGSGHAPFLDAPGGFAKMLDRFIADVMR